MDYIQGDESQEVDGVYYPAWDLKDNAIPIDLTWKPYADAICNGSTCAFNLLEPESYGASKDEIIYSAIGRYISAEDKHTTDARMFLRNDTTELRNITGYSGSLQTGLTAVDITPAQGDSWLNLETWIEKDAQGVYKITYHDGWEIPFADKKFYFRQAPPDPGNYLVAIMVEDMDGQRFYQFASFSIAP
jgi:hypothetical protein